jgi:uncharacterized protein (TIGR03083 family)
MEAAAALRPLVAVADDDPRWQAIAAPTDWSAAHTIEHIADTLLFYSGQVARRATRGYGIIRNGRDTKPSGHLRDLETATAIFLAVLRDLGDGRALHPSGTADAPGWVGMAVTEMLVHGYDAAAALNVPIELPEDVCARTLERVFPWVQRGPHSAVTMLLCETGRVTVDGSTGPEDWWWQAAPLSEWDGKPRRRTLDPAWK